MLDGLDPIDVATSQMNVADIGPLKLRLQEGQPRPRWTDVSAGTSELKTLWRQWDKLTIMSNLLYRKFVIDDLQCLYQLVTPTDRYEEVIKYHHDIATGGHLGVEKTLHRIRQTFYWTETINRYIEKCHNCIASKLSRGSNKAPLGQNIVG